MHAKSTLKKYYKLLLRCFAAWALLPCFSLFADQPHLTRSANLLTAGYNPDISGSTGWALGNGAAYDFAVSRDGGTGSLKLTGTSTSYINSDFIAVTPGKTYTLSFYMLSDIFPPPGPYPHVAYYISSHGFVRNSFGSDQSVTALNSWQECVYLFRPQPGDAYVKIIVPLNFQPIGYSGSVWLDNFYLGEGVGFEQAPTAKTAFNGTKTKIDALGNVQIYKNGVWIPFFPIGVYGDGDRPDWTIYSTQGFNTSMVAGYYVTIQKARDAVSDFNPDGMMSALEFDQFIPTGDVTSLTTRINEIKNPANGVLDYLLWYYWDNEYYSAWDNPQALTNTIKELDVDANGYRMHPVYALQGHEGLARKYNNSNATMTDITGDYVAGGDTTDETRGALGLVTLDNVEQQQNPVVVAQVNHGVGILFRPRVFAAIAKGAKAIGFWRDKYQGTDQNYAIDIGSEPWWNDLPHIRSEIDQLLPIIRTPHWTNWSLSSNNSLTDFGIRDYYAKGYVIVTNEQTSDQIVIFTIAGLPYTATKVRDFFTRQITAEITSSQFTVTVSHCSLTNLQGGSQVYVLESNNNIEDMLSLKLLCNENGGNTVYDGSYFANNGTLNGNASLASGVLSLDGSGDFADCGKKSSMEMGKLDLSIVARIKISASQSGTYAGIVTKGAAQLSNIGYYFAYRTDTQKLTLILSDGSSRLFLYAPTAFNLKDNAWHTVGVSLARNGNAEFYLDSVSKGTADASSLASSDITNATQDLFIGSGGYGDYLNGQMDNIRIYKKALSATEMSDIAVNTIFDAQLNSTEGSTTIPYDSSINSNNGALYGNAAFGGGVITLAENGDYADFGNSSALDIGTNDMTIISRIKLNPTQNTYCGIVTKGAGSSTDAGYALFYTGGHLAFTLSNGTTTPARVWVNSNSVALKDNVWHTVGVAVTRGGNAVFYVDGSSVGSGSVGSLSGCNIANSVRNLQLGTWLSYGPYSLLGSMDYARIYKRALSSDEMAAATR